MNDYEISEKTLAIIPIGNEKSKIVDEYGDYIINKTPMKIIDESCRYFGSSYEGRFCGTKKMIGISHKSPIIIEESRKIIFFPTHSPRIKNCTWISFNNIMEYKGDGKDSTIKFSCGKSIDIHSSYSIIDNQVLRSTRLESVLSKRINKFS